VLVLYKVQENGEWVTKCDYLRFWSSAGTSAAFHHHAMHVAKAHIIKKVPGLKTLRIWTDGHKSTYKGSPNFGRMSYWPLDMPTEPEPGRVSELTLVQAPGAPQDFECNNDRLLVSALSGEAAAQEAALMAAERAAAQSAPRSPARASSACTMRAHELREALAGAGLSTTGPKQVLVERFHAASLGPEPAAAPPAPPKQWRVHKVDGAVVRTRQELEDALQRAKDARRYAHVSLLEVPHSLFFLILFVMSHASELLS